MGYVIIPKLHFFKPWRNKQSLWPFWLVADICVICHVRRHLVQLSPVRQDVPLDQTVCIDWKHILSRVRVSVRPSNFLYTENTQNHRKYWMFIWMKQRSAMFRRSRSIDRQRPVWSVTIWTTTTAIVVATDCVKTAKKQQAKASRTSVIPSRPGQFGWGIIT